MAETEPAHSEHHTALVRSVIKHMQVQVVQGSWQHHRNGYRMDQRVISFHNVIHVMQGRAVWVLDDQPITLDPGDLLIVPPSLPHHAYSETKRVSLGSYHLKAQLPGGRNIFNLLQLPLLRRLPADSRLEQILRLAAHEYKQPLPDAKPPLQAWGWLILAQLIAVDHAAGRLDPQPLDPIVAQLLDELEDSVASPPTLDELAEHAGYSPQHLNRLFKQAIGLTPLQYLTHTRMARAAQLLTEGKQTVAAVGEAVGYDNPFYFSRMFRKHHGVSPGQYQRTACSESAGTSSSTAWP